MYSKPYKPLTKPQDKPKSGDPLPKEPDKRKRALLAAALRKSPSEV